MAVFIGWRFSDFRYNAGVADIDFVMSYPCFVPLHPNGMPFTFTADGDCCVAVFTDDDLVTQFVQSRKLTRVGRAKVSDANNLADFLSKCDNSENDQGQIITHVIIDPSPGRQASVYSVKDFITHIRSNP